MSYEQAFLAAIDDMDAGCLHDPGHYLRAVPVDRHEEFTRCLAGLIVARGPSGHDAEPTAEAFKAALAAVAAVRETDQGPG